MKLLWLILSVIVGVALVNPLPASADTSWRINRFHSDISIQPDGRVKIIETLEVDFGSTEKHGIFRNIPYQYQSDKQTVFTNLEIWNVLRDENKESYSTSLSDGYEELKIGDADKTISGQHTYEITYFASGILRGFDGYDELYWNVTGNYWDVAIGQASATVTLPKSGVLQTACYQGQSGSTDNCQSVAMSPLETRFAATLPLKPSEGLTVSVGYTKAIVPLLTVDKPQSPAAKWLSQAKSWQGLGLMGIAALAGLTLPIYLWWKKGRDWSWQQPGMLESNQMATLMTSGNQPQIVVEYSPPENLRPAQMGLLLDEETKTLDITSTIIDLACRGYLTIKELPKSWALGSKDYQMNVTTKQTSNLLTYEKRLLERLFDGKKTVKLSELKDKFYTDLAEVKGLVRKDLLSRNYFSRDPETVQTLYRVVAISLIVAGGLGGFFSISQNWFVVSLVAVLILTVGVALLAFSGAMPQRTALGSEMYRRVLGYKLFISTAEKHRQQFFEKENLFNQILPYAMLFGLTKKFAQAMKDIGYEPAQPGWYSGQAAFNIVAFSSSMSDVSKSISSTMASAPSSSGSGGGGSSGGGFGGGGGGSW